MKRSQRVKTSGIQCTSKKILDRYSGKAAVTLEQRKNQLAGDIKNLERARKSVEIRTPRSKTDRKRQQKLLKSIDDTIKNRRAQQITINQYERSERTEDDKKRLRSFLRILNQSRRRTSIEKYNPRTGAVEVCVKCLMSGLKKTNPCRGQGLDSPRVARRVARRMKHIYKSRWWRRRRGESTQRADRRRRRALQNAANAELQRIGHPGIRVGKHTAATKRRFQDRPGLQGSHSPSQSKVMLRPETTSSNTPPPTTRTGNPPPYSQKEVGETLYHEARHAEQTYLAAVHHVREVRGLYKSLGLKPQSQKQERNMLVAAGIDPRVARAASKAPRKGSRKDPLRGREACAKTMWENGFESDPSHKETQNTAKRRAAAKYKAAKKARLQAARNFRQAHAAFNKNPNRTTVTALRQAQNSFRRSDKNYEQAKRSYIGAHRYGYEALPNELDSRQTQATFGKQW